MIVLVVLAWVVTGALVLAALGLAVRPNGCIDPATNGFHAFLMSVLACVTLAAALALSFSPPT